MTPHQNIRLLINNGEDNKTISRMVYQKHKINVSEKRINEIRQFMKKQENLDISERIKIYGSHALRLPN